MVYHRISYANSDISQIIVDIIGVNKECKFSTRDRLNSQSLFNLNSLVQGYDQKTL